MRKSFSALSASLFFAVCAHARADEGKIEIVESWPLETVLDNKDLGDTAAVWGGMIEDAAKTLDIETFYISNKSFTALDGVIAKIREAAARGVKVRIIADKKFHGFYPETLDSLGKEKNIEVRAIDIEKLSGGVMHAKHFIVDGREVFLGSQNFDWRSLDHVRELGLRIEDEAFAGAVTDLFELDWLLAKTENPEAAGKLIKRKRYPVPFKVAGAEITPVFSPKGWFADEALFEEDRLIELLDSAKHDILLQVLSYSPVSRDGKFDGRLDAALRRAAVRGVKVKLIVADWAKKKPEIDHLKSLSVLPNIEIKLSTIPQWSGGFIPFARVQHAKLLVVDSGAFWLGTSNWSKDYFYNSRNTGVIVKDRKLTARLRSVFFTDWMGPYTYFVDPARDYIPPQVGD